MSDGETMRPPAKRRETARPAKIISGGQTGVDRGGLDAAMRLGIEHGGCCPKGRRAEDGVIPAEYRLTESEHRSYRSRTRQNVLDSDGTLILYRTHLSGGTELTCRYAQRFSKPVLLLSLESNPDPACVRQWLQDEQIAILNVAGPRESEFPGAQLKAARFLCDAFR